MYKHKHNTLLAKKLEALAGSIPSSNPTALEHVFTEWKSEEKRLLNRAYTKLCVRYRAFDVDIQAQEKLLRAQGHGPSALEEAFYGGNTPELTKLRTEFVRSFIE